MYRATHEPSLLRATGIPCHAISYRLVAEIRVNAEYNARNIIVIFFRFLQMRNIEILAFGIDPRVKACFLRRTD